MSQMLADFKSLTAVVWIPDPELVSTLGSDHGLNASVPECSRLEESQPRKSRSSGSFQCCKRVAVYESYGGMVWMRKKEVCGSCELYSRMGACGEASRSIDALYT
jgi:hypothetical protein